MAPPKSCRARRFSANSIHFLRAWHFFRRTKQQTTENTQTHLGGYVKRWGPATFHRGGSQGVSYGGASGGVGAQLDHPAVGGRGPARFSPLWSPDGRCAPAREGEGHPPRSTSRRAAGPGAQSAPQGNPRAAGRGRSTVRNKERRRGTDDGDGEEEEQGKKKKIKPPTHQPRRPSAG